MYSDFSGWSYAGNGQKAGKLSVVNQVLAISGRLSQRLLFGFLDWLPQTVTRFAELVTVGNDLLLRLAAADCRSGLWWLSAAVFSLSAQSLQLSNVAPGNLS